MHAEPARHRAVLCCPNPRACMLDGDPSQRPARTGVTYEAFHSTPPTRGYILLGIWECGRGPRGRRAGAAAYACASCGRRPATGHPQKAQET